MAILNEKTLDFVSSSAAQTERLGVRLGELLEPGDLICLAGSLGSGKTCLARGISRGWGAATSATSPTFTLLNEYPRADDSSPLLHLDCYRLEGPNDALDMGIDDILARNAVMMIEWSDKIASVLPKNRLWIDMRWIASSKRGLCLQAEGDRYVELLSAFRQSAFGV